MKAQEIVFELIISPVNNFCYEFDAESGDLRIILLSCLLRGASFKPQVTFILCNGL